MFELARKFGIHRSTIGRHLRARGVDTRPDALGPEDVLRAAELYRSGWSLMRIARRYEVAGDTARRRLLEAGVQMRGPHERRAMTRHLLVAAVARGTPVTLLNVHAATARPPSPHLLCRPNRLHSVVGDADEDTKDSVVATLEFINTELSSRLSRQDQSLSRIEAKAVVVPASLRRLPSSSQPEIRFARRGRPCLAWSRSWPTHARLRSGSGRCA